MHQKRIAEMDREVTGRARCPLPSPRPLSGTGSNRNRGNSPRNPTCPTRPPRTRLQAHPRRHSHKVA
jgi:hypothetical protein